MDSAFDSAPAHTPTIDCNGARVADGSVAVLHAGRGMEGGTGDAIIESDEHGHQVVDLYHLHGTALPCLVFLED